MKIEVSNGEIIDKLAIIEIKLGKIKGESRRKNLKREYEVLKNAAQRMKFDFNSSLYKQLLEANKKLWDIEDEIRECERKKDFGPRFIDLARRIYVINDKRSEIKRQINMETGSVLVEEKEYEKY